VACSLWIADAGGEEDVDRGVDSEGLEPEVDAASNADGEKPSSVQISEPKR
jgi:hypothetical protein